MLQPLNADRHPIGPFVRVLAAVFLGSLAALLIHSAQSLYHAETIAPNACPARRSAHFCNLGNWLLSIIPPPWQVYFVAVAYVAFASVCAALVWWLLKPLLPRRPA